MKYVILAIILSPVYFWHRDQKDKPIVPHRTEQRVIARQSEPVKTAKENGGWPVSRGRTGLVRD